MDEAKRPGRPRAFDRTAAMRAARELFWERGYARTSASDLAEAMGIGRSSFYNAFGDKEAVYREARTEYLGSAPDAALAALGPDEPVVPAIWNVLRTLCRVRAEDPRARGCLMVNSIAELTAEHGALHTETRRLARERIEELDRLLARAESAGEVPPFTDRRATASALVTFLMGLNVMSRVVRSEAELWKIGVQTLAGLGLPPPPDPGRS